MATKLIPNIEKRLSTWVELQEKLVPKEEPKPRSTVTISRQYGCEGYPLAMKVKELLEKETGETWVIFDKYLLEKVSEGDSEYSEKFLKNLGDDTNFMDHFATFVPRAKTHGEGYKKLAKYISRIATKGNAIIVGRGGSIVCQEHENCFHFRVEADEDYRINSIKERMQLSEDEARKDVKDNQKKIEKFIEDFLSCKIGDITWYHANFNNGKNSVDQMATGILELIKGRLLKG